MRHPLLLILALLTGASCLSPSTGLAQAVPQPTPSTGTEEAVVSGIPVQRAKFAIFVQGFPLGSEEVFVDRTPQGWTVNGSGTIGAPVGLALRQAHVAYGNRFEPREMKVEGFLGDQRIDLSVAVTGNSAVTSYSDNGAPKQTTEAVSADAVVLSGNFFGAYAALAARVAKAVPGQTFRLLISPYPEKVIVLREVLNERIQIAARSFAVRRHVLAFDSQEDPLELELETEADGKLVRLTIPSTQFQFAREDVVSVAARQQRFIREGDEDVNVPANGFSLTGTLSRPRTLPPPPAGRRTARLPAVILVPGVSSTDRDGVEFGIPVHGQLAAGLADAGFLVLRYDKRGVGQSGGRTEGATLADYADDVVNVVRWVEKRSDVDAKSITILGRSDGAWVAMLAAAREKRVTKVVLVSAVSAKGTDFMLEQQKEVLARGQLPEDQRRQRVALQMQIHEAILRGGTWEGVPRDLRGQAESPWFASYLAFDPGQVMSKIRQPLLVVAAERDQYVRVHHADTLAGFGRARKKDPGVAVVTVPGINHLLVPAATGQVEEYGSLRDQAVSAGVSKEIAAWIFAP